MTSGAASGSAWEGRVSWGWLAVCAAMVAVMGYLRLVVWPDRIVPLAYALPLLVCLWNRDLRLLWGMAGAFLLMVVTKAVMLPREAGGGPEHNVFVLMQVGNILIPAAVIHGVVLLRGRLEATIGALEKTNAELEASNEELASREEEISRQNEELQCQAEELEQQMEELNSQAEELQGLNEQLAMRERTLADLLETTSSGAGVAATLASMGAMVKRLIGDRAEGAALLEPMGDRMAVRPLLGLKAGGADRLHRERTLSALALARDRAAFLADLSLRPDLEAPALETGRVRSVLTAPLRVGEAAGCALEVYSTEEGEWSEHELRVAQWVAEQCGRLWTDARLREELERQRQLLRTVTENASAALFMTDDRGRCTYMNPAAEALTGVKFRDAQDRLLHAVVHAGVGAGAAGGRGSHAQEACPLHEEPDAEGGQREDVFVTPDGEEVPVVCTMIPVRRDGRWAATVLEARDIREQLRHEQERESLLDGERAARGEAERASRAKDEFVATLSHELRTPLNAIMGWATLLRKGADGPEDLAKGLEVIERNARSQAQLISDLLDISRVTSGKIRLDVQPVDLPLVLESAMEAVRPAADAKEVRLERVIETMDRVVMGDPSRLQQVAWNLLTNAIKFTSRGGSVQVVLARVASYVQLTISDTGQGIPPEMLPHIFERYRQADASTSRRHGGLGLGLAICRSLVELHGGSIHAKSDGKGKGAAFTVLLPVRAVDAADPAPGLHPASSRLERPGLAASPSLGGVSVLVVEDERDARELIRRVLEERGATVETAASGEEALEALRRSRPSVMISDIGMPGMDGYTLIRRVRAEIAPSPRELPAIALTAFARSEDRTRALLSGFQSHISKPVEPAELVATVASMSATLRPWADGESAR